ncbi:MAG: CoA transferase [Proteobacteria bacterium]|nr:CoA transferase [Pseudomonadota bacterium]
MGPLKGMKIVELGGIGPGPFCAQMLSDMGADIIRVDRKGTPGTPEQAKYQVLHRGRRSIAVDLKKTEGVETVLKLIEQAEALLEGFRPGVMERLGLGPEVCLDRNPKLVYGRMTGWGQEGPMAQAAGHDINYISLTGALHAIGRPGEKPVPPLNLIGDFGGGGMLLAFGIMCGVYEARNSGKGQVVDAAMVDGSAALMGMFYGMYASGLWKEETGTNLLDGGAHFYDTYETSDGKWISVGSIEPQFYALLLKHTGIDDPDFQNQMDMTKWPEFKEKVTEIFKTKTRDEWCAIMEGTDVCFAPVLSFSESIKHPHNVERNLFVDVGGVVQPGPAPRFSRTKPEIQGPPPAAGQHNEPALKDWGLGQDEIEALKAKEVI